MGQIKTGARKILEFPFCYDILQRIMGDSRYKLEFIRDYLKPQPGMSVLDIGCGTGSLLQYLPEGTKYIGYDPSEQYIEAARTRFGGKGEFHCGFFNDTIANRHSEIDVVVTYGVLHHLNDEEAINLLQLTKRVLIPRGKFISIDCVISKEQSPIARFLISKDRGENVRTKDGYELLASAQFSNVRSVIKHRKFIPYTHCIMECWN